MPDEVYNEIDKLPIPIQDIYSAQEAATLLGIRVARIRDLAKRKEDPFPLRRLQGMHRGSIVFRDELLEWARNNFNLIGNKH